MAAPGLEIRGDPAAAGAAALDTGEPPSISSRPARVTAACSPLPKTVSPPMRCVHETWWMPAMSR
jgi:hypothetical protein